MFIDTNAFAYRAGQRAFRAGLPLRHVAGAYADPASAQACENGYSDAATLAGVPLSTEEDPGHLVRRLAA